jgi:hypothetical protein
MWVTMTADLGELPEVELRPQPAAAVRTMTSNGTSKAGADVGFLGTRDIAIPQRQAIERCWTVRIISAYDGDARFVVPQILLAHEPTKEAKEPGSD